MPEGPIATIIREKLTAGLSPERLVIEDDSRVDCVYFTMSEDNVRREVAIGETITPQELAQKMAVKATIAAIAILPTMLDGVIGLGTSLPRALAVAGVTSPA